jgi:hypothetical protein
MWTSWKEMIFVLNFSCITWHRQTRLCLSIFEQRPFSIARQWALSRNLLSKDLSDFNLQKSMYGGLSPLLWISRKNFNFSHTLIKLFIFCLAWSWLYTTEAKWWQKLTLNLSLTPINITLTLILTLNLDKYLFFLI